MMILLYITQFLNINNFVFIYFYFYLLDYHIIRLKMISYQYKKKRLFFLNSSFNSDFTLIDAKINEINFDISPFQLYKNNSLKVISFIRDHHQSKPIQIKLKDLIYDSRINYNTDKEAFPTIYSSHTGVECMLNNNYNSLTLLPQQITKFNLKVNDNFNQINYNYYFSSLTNGTLENVVNSPDKYIIFKSSGSFVLDKSLNCDILIVGGGGAGGNSMGGGGGAGGVVYTLNQVLNAGSYYIKVGAGGVGATQVQLGTRGNSGEDSGIMNSSQTSYISMNFGGTIRELKALGGGGGGSYYNAAQSIGGDGGSGGGASENNNEVTYTGGSSTQPATLWDGNSYISGGSSGNSSIVDATLQYFSGGGGGAGATNFNNNYRNGKTGITIDITGNSITYAAGGGGGSYGSSATITTGLGGSSIGGDGTVWNMTNTLRTATSGLANSGSGGGGLAYSQSGGTAGSGGSGVVIIRFKNKRIEGLTPEETLINTNNSNIIINQPSQYQINYEPPIKIDKGTYSANFTSNIGGITFLKSPDYTYPILKTNPLVWYKFDSSDLGKDEMNNHNLINNGETVYNTNDYNKGIGSASFDGNNDYLSKASAFNLNSKDFSISLWIKKTDNSRIDRLINIGSTYTTNTTLLLTYDSDNKIRFGFWANDLVSSSTYTDAGSWVYLTFTYKTGTKVRKIYRNGVLIANDIASGELNTNNNLFIGNQSTYYFKGLMDDFRIYEKELTQLEINELYYGNANRSYPLLKDGNNETINPLVWYKFDNSNNLGYDDIRNHDLTNNNGTAYNSNDYTKGSGSASFDGTNDFLSNTSAFNLNSKDFSISLWIKRDENSRIDFFIELGSVNATRQKLLMAYTLENTIYFGFYNDTLNLSGYTDDAGKWIHLVYTYKTGTKVRKIYRNGVLIGNDTSGGELNTTNDFKIGNHNTLYFKGLMDDLRIYERELTATQVQELYLGRIQIFNPPSFLLGLELEDKELEEDNIASIYR